MKKQIRIKYDRKGMQKEVVEVVDARERGEYELEVKAQHSQSYTKGKVTVRVVAGAGARVKVKGVIKISKGVKEVENFLELRALTLDKTALVTLDPELEIEANQVKAGHAASVGPINMEQLLYLRSRGLTLEQAREVVVDGWLGNEKLTK